MKYTKLTALLGLAEITLHSGTFSMGTPFAKLNEEQLDLIENALAKDQENDLAKDHENDIIALQNQLTEATSKASAFEKITTEAAKAIETAMQTAGLEKQEGMIENINLLAEKCKEFGEDKNRHSFPDNNGKEEGSEELIDGYLNPKDFHNQLINNL